MITIRAILEKRGLLGKNLPAAIVQVKRDAMQDLGEHFHAVNLPRRFTEAGGISLGFARRTPRYVKRKLKRFGHRDPLVWSGASKELALGIRDVRARATRNSSVVRIVLHCRGLNRRSGDIRMADEVRTISPREFGPLTRYLDRSIQKRLKAMDSQ